MSKKNQSSVFRQASYLIMRHAATQFKLIWLQLFCRCGDSSVQVCVFSRRSYLLLCSHTEPRHQTLCDQYRWLGILLSIFKKRVTEIFSTLFLYGNVYNQIWKCVNWLWWPLYIVTWNSRHVQSTWSAHWAPIRTTTLIRWHHSHNAEMFYHISVFRVRQTVILSYTVNLSLHLLFI